MFSMRWNPAFGMTSADEAASIAWLSRRERAAALRRLLTLQAVADKGEEELRAREIRSGTGRSLDQPACPTRAAGVVWRRQRRAV